MTEFGHQLGFLAPWLHDYGVAAVFVILTFESCGFPLPGESLLIIAGILCGRGEMSMAGLIAAGAAGGVIGDNIGYLIGRLVGISVVARYGQKVGLTAERLAKVEAVFAKYGPATVLFARFFVVLRQLNGIVAGLMKMDWWLFLAFNALGAVLWVGLWTMVGRFVGMHAAEVDALAHRLGVIGVGSLVLLAVSVPLLVRLRSRLTDG